MHPPPWSTFEASTDVCKTLERTCPSRTLVHTRPSYPGSPGLEFTARGCTQTQYKVALLVPRWNEASVLTGRSTDVHSSQDHNWSLFPVHIRPYSQLGLKLAYREVYRNAWAGTNRALTAPPGECEHTPSGPVAFNERIHSYPKSVPTICKL